METQGQFAILCCPDIEKTSATARRSLGAVLGCVDEPMPTAPAPLSNSPDSPEWRAEESPYKRIIWHYGHPIRFRSKESFEMLKILIENRGGCVDHAVLSAIAWPDVVAGIEKETLDARIANLNRFLCKNGVKCAQKKLKFPIKSNDGESYLVETRRVINPENLH